MKKILLITLAVLSITAAKSQTIGAARSAGLGSTVTVNGMVTHGSELGIIRYLQDNTGGIGAYPGAGSASGFSVVALGDSVTITGVLKEFKNLLEIDPITAFTVHTSGNTLPAAQVITPATFDENVEGELVKIMNCTFAASGTFTGNASGNNYTVTSNSQTFVLRILPSNTSIVGTPIPTVAVDITGIASQFCNTPTVGCTSGYQLLARTISDITTSAPAGINEQSINNQLSVYPNPSSTKINFVIANGSTVKSAVLTDALGKVVYTSDKNTNSIDVSSFPNGIYYLMVETNKNKYQTKVSVSK